MTRLLRWCVPSRIFPRDIHDLAPLAWEFNIWRAAYYRASGRYLYVAGDFETGKVMWNGRP